MAHLEKVIFSKKFKGPKEADIIKKSFFVIVVTMLFGFSLSQKASYATEPNLWKKEFGVGYSQTNGNTNKSSLLANLNGERKKENTEINLKANMLYASANKKMDGQKWYGMARYGLRIWGEKWVNFYRVETDHDRFANINYRIIPSLGLGFWFSDTDDWKALTELGIGATYTNYRDSSKNTAEATIIPRAFFDKRLFNETHLTEDITIYPSLKTSGHYRLHSETAFNNPISGQLIFKISLIDDYNSHPVSDKKRNDTQLVTSLNYSF